MNYELPGSVQVGRSIAVFRLFGVTPSGVSNRRAPLQDAEQAVHLICANAAKWKTNPEKIGVMGISAGGHAVSFIGTTTDDIEKIGDKIDKFSFTPNFMFPASPIITMGDGVLTHF